MLGKRTAVSFLPFRMHGAAWPRIAELLLVLKGEVRVRTSGVVTSAL
jgi:hypothetical protein